MPPDRAMAMDGTELPAPLAHLAPRIARGRAIRTAARAIVATRGDLAERAAWIAARAPGLDADERAWREGVAARISRMFAFVGRDRRH
jgi:hypothetical protein